MQDPQLRIRLTRHYKEAHIELHAAGAGENTVHVASVRRTRGGNGYFVLWIGAFRKGFPSVRGVSVVEAMEFCEVQWAQFVATQLAQVMTTAELRHLQGD